MLNHALYGHLNDLTCIFDCLVGCHSPAGPSTISEYRRVGEPSIFVRFYDYPKYIGLHYSYLDCIKHGSVFGYITNSASDLSLLTTSLPRPLYASLIRILEQVPLVNCPVASDLCPREHPARYLMAQCR